jgi:cleavage and polyadenylation specificity factor subunit 1
MFDDETGLEPKIVTASIVDPYLLLVRDDASLFVAQCDDNNDLEEIEKVDDKLLATKWLSGSLYKDVKGVFSGEGSKADAEPMVYMFALSAEGSLFVSYDS